MFHFREFRSEFGIDFLAVIEVVGKRRMDLSGAKMGVLADDFLGGPTISEMIRDDLRYAHAWQTLQPGNLVVGLLNMRIVQQRHVRIFAARGWKCNAVSNARSRIGQVAYLSVDFDGLIAVRSMNSMIIPATSFFDDCFDAFEAGRGIHLHHDRAVVRAEQIDAGDVESHGLGGARWRRCVPAGVIFTFSAEPPRWRFERNSPLAAWRFIEATTLPPTTTQRMSAPSASLMNSWTRMFALRSLKASMTDSAALAVSREHHADALGAFEQFDHERRAAAHLDELAGGVRVVGEAGDRQADAAFREDLQRAQLVARAGDGDRVVEREDVHHLELPDHGIAVKRVPGGDARDHRVCHEFLAIDENPRFARGDVHVTAEVIDHADFVAAGLGGVDERRRCCRVSDCGKG